MNEEYYLDLNIPFFTDALVDRLSDHANIAISTNQFHTYSGYTSTEKFVNIVSKEPTLKELIDSCNCKANITMMLLNPWFAMDIHIDDYYLDVRKTAILLPIIPEFDIANTNYYETKHDKHPFLTVSWKKGQPKILNVETHWHNVVNNAYWRGMLQISLDKTYYEVCDMIKTNTLFNGINCTVTTR